MKTLLSLLLHEGNYTPQQNNVEDNEQGLVEGIDYIINPDEFPTGMMEKTPNTTITDTLNYPDAGMYEMTPNMDNPYEPAVDGDLEKRISDGKKFLKQYLMAIQQFMLGRR
jgi:hypothetical protein